MRSARLAQFVLELKKESSAVHLRGKCRFNISYILYCMSQGLSHSCSLCLAFSFSLIRISQKRSTMSRLRGRKWDLHGQGHLWRKQWHMTADAPQPTSQNHDAVSMRAEANSLPSAVCFQSRLSDARKYKQKWFSRWIQPKTFNGFYKE